MPNSPVPNETASIYSDALSVFTVHAQFTGKRLLDVADTSTNAEIRILTALQASAEAYRFYGFSQLILEMNKLAHDEVPSPVVEMVEKTEKESRVAALNFIKVLRNEGFTTSEINDLSDMLRSYNENARLLGQAEALVEFKKS